MNRKDMIDAAMRRAARRAAQATVDRKNALKDPAVTERLYYVRKALKLPQSEILDAMAKIKREDPDLDWEYALYHFVFERKNVSDDEGFYLLECEDGITRIKLVVARKGAFSPNPEYRDQRYEKSRIPDLRAEQGRPFKAFLPKAYAPL